MPPAFILSQNQTLNFNSFKARASPLAPLWLCYLCWLCFLRCRFFLRRNLRHLIDGNCFLFALLSNKISFLSYSVFKLLLVRTTVRSPPLGESLSIIPHLSYLCQAFWKTFFTFFSFFFARLCFSAFSTRSSGQLVYITTSLLLLSTLFRHLFVIFLFFYFFSPVLFFTHPLFPLFPAHSLPSLDFFNSFCYHFFIPFSPFRALNFVSIVMRADSSPYPASLFSEAASKGRKPKDNFVPFPIFSQTMQKEILSWKIYESSLPSSPRCSLPRSFLWARCTRGHGRGFASSAAFSFSGLCCCASRSRKKTTSARGTTICPNWISLDPIRLNERAGKRTTRKRASEKSCFFNIGL